MLQLSEFVWALDSLVWVVFINFLLIEVRCDQKRLFFAFNKKKHRQWKKEEIPYAYVQEFFTQNELCL